MTGLLVETDPNVENAAVEDLREALVEKAAAFAVTLDQDAAGRMLSWVDRLLDANRHVNLTAVRDRAQAIERHLLDSLAFGLHVKTAGMPRRAVDLGSGGGFPGAPIAIAWPGCEVHLVDSTRKKVEALERIATPLGLPNLRLHWGRGEELAGSSLAEIADAVVVRAVGPLEELVRGARGMLASRGFLVAWKSDLTEPERAGGAAAAARAGMESLPDIEYQLDRERRLVRFRRRD